MSVLTYMSVVTYITAVDDKPLVWLSGEVKTPPFSEEARRESGFLLRTLQCGEKLSMPQASPMPNIGRGCHELRVKDENINWRIFVYVDADAVVILEVDKKKTRKTPKAVIDVCKERLKRHKEV